MHGAGAGLELKPMADPGPLLEALARELWLPGLVCSSGALEPRLHDLARWRDRLLEGELPETDADFDDRPVATALREVAADQSVPILVKLGRP